MMRHLSGLVAVHSCKEKIRGKIGRPSYLDMCQEYHTITQKGTLTR